jgi:hypothetical protein
LFSIALYRKYWPVTTASQISASAPLGGPLGGVLRERNVVSHLRRTTSARPRLVVGDHAAALLALGLGAGLGLLLALALVVAAAVAGRPASVKPGGGEVGDHPHRHVGLVRISGRVVLLVAVLPGLVVGPVIVGVAVLVLGVDPLLDEVDAGTRHLRPLVLGQRLALVVDQPGDAQHLVGLLDFLGGEHGQALVGEAVECLGERGGVGLALGGLVAQPLRGVRQRPVAAQCVVEALGRGLVALDYVDSFGPSSRMTGWTVPSSAGEAGGYLL